jgi:hypothetical protein
METIITDELLDYLGDSYIQTKEYLENNGIEVILNFTQFVERWLEDVKN